MTLATCRVIWSYAMQIDLNLAIPSFHEQMEAIISGCKLLVPGWQEVPVASRAGTNLMGSSKGRSWYICNQASHLFFLVPSSSSLSCAKILWRFCIIVKNEGNPQSLLVRTYLVARVLGLITLDLCMHELQGLGACEALC